MNCTETDDEDILAPKSKRRKEIGKDDTACIGQHVMFIIFLNFILHAGISH